MNKKGQVLVLFIVVIPVITLFLLLFINYGLISIETKKISNNTKDALEYYLNNLNSNNIKNKTIKLLESNLDDAQIDITDDENEVIIIVKKKDIIIKYVGNKNTKKIIKG